jgi:hypothetical protein
LKKPKEGKKDNQQETIEIIRFSKITEKNRQ